MDTKELKKSGLVSAEALTGAVSASALTGSRIPARDTRFFHNKLILEEVNKLWNHSTVPDVDLEKVANDLRDLLSVVSGVAAEYGIDAESFKKRRKAVDA